MRRRRLERAMQRLVVYSGPAPITAARGWSAGGGSGLNGRVRGVFGGQPAARAVFPGAPKGAVCGEDGSSALCSGSSSTLGLRPPRRARVVSRWRERAASTAACAACCFCARSAARAVFPGAPKGAVYGEDGSSALYSGSLSTPGLRPSSPRAGGGHMACGVVRMFDRLPACLRARSSSRPHVAVDLRCKVMSEVALIRLAVCVLLASVLPSRGGFFGPNCAHLLGCLGVWPCSSLLCLPPAACLFASSPRPCHSPCVLVLLQVLRLVPSCPSRLGVVGDRSS